MSYDLFLRSRSLAVSPGAFFDYFRGRARYKVENKQAWYQNEESGVYFAFEYADADERDGPHPYRFSFTINFFRPSYFILEAEPEVTALVDRFDFLVSDPQTKGMGDGVYAPELLETNSDMRRS